MSRGAVVITGAAGDMGAALAAAFAGAGHVVFGADVRPVTAPGVTAVAVDVTDRAAVFALAGQAAEEADGLVLWVNAAGIVRTVPVREAAEDDWHRLIGVNLTGTWHGCVAALETMIAGGRGGCIINIGSLSGQVGYPGLHPGYGASKAAVHQLTKTYAMAGARHGIRVNAVAPSVLDGAMGDTFSDDQKARLVKATPLRRLGRMGDVVGAVRYLASEEAAFVTGTVLPVNGGSWMP